MFIFFTTALNFLLLNFSIVRPTITDATNKNKEVKTVCISNCSKKLNIVIPFLSKTSKNTSPTPN